MIKPIHTLLRLMVPGLLLLVAAGPVRSQYAAETGRTMQVSVPQDSQVDEAKGADGPVYEVALEDLWSPELAAQIQASGVDRLAVQSEGVNTSLRTWAEIQVHGVTGKSSLKLKDGTRIPAVYMALAMVYENQLWVRSPILPMESPELAKLLGLPYGKGVRVAPTTIMKNKTARTLVMAALSDNQTQLAGLTDSQKRSLRQFGSHLATFLNLPGELRIVPMAGQADLWIAPSHIQRPELLHNDDLAGQVRALNVSAEPYLSTLALDKALKTAFTSRSGYGVQEAVTQAAASLKQSPGYMGATLLRLDWIKTGIKPYQKASWIFLLSFLAFIAYLMSTRPGSGSNASQPGKKDLPKVDGPSGGTKATLANAVAFQGLGNPPLALAGVDGPSASVAVSESHPAFFRKTTEAVDSIIVAEAELDRGYRPLWWLAYALLFMGCAFLVTALLARFALGGRMPVSNMFEATTFCLSAFAVIAVVAEGWLRRGWVGITGAFFGWTLMLIVNMMPMHQRKVEPLIAVLDSIWLNYHVTSLLISYACFLMAFGASIVQITKLKFGNTPGLLPRAEVFENIAFRSTQVGWPLLTFGVFLGAVWANTAWGSYWSWDPKETWSLITWFGYTIYLHLRMTLGWKDQRAGWANILGFVLVLVTFFGVSYLPGLAGGMHTYASPISK